MPFFIHPVSLCIEKVSLVDNFQQQNRHFHALARFRRKHLVPQHHNDPQLGNYSTDPPLLFPDKRNFQRSGFPPHARFGSFPESFQRVNQQGTQNIRRDTRKWPLSPPPPTRNADTRLFALLPHTRASDTHAHTPAACARERVRACVCVCVGKGVGRGRVSLEAEAHHHHRRRSRRRTVG